jgi:hypothetical protein
MHSQWSKEEVDPHTVHAFKEIPVNSVSLYEGVALDTVSRFDSALGFQGHGVRRESLTRRRTQSWNGRDMVKVFVSCARKLV